MQDKEATMTALQAALGARPTSGGLPSNIVPELPETCIAHQNTRGPCVWLFAQKPLEAPNHPKPPQTPNFPENPAMPRNLAGIPTEFILSVILNSTEFPSGEERNSRNRPLACKKLCNLIATCLVRCENYRNWPTKSKTGPSASASETCFAGTVLILHLEKSPKETHKDERCEFKTEVRRGRSDAAANANDAGDPRPPHTRQKYEQTSGQNMTPNASKQGKFGSLGAIFLFIFLPCMWGLGGCKKNPQF